MSFDFDAAVQSPFHLQPGLRQLAPGTVQLTPLTPGSRHQREKLAVLSTFADQALVMRPGFDPMPALDTLCRQAAAEHPACWAWDGRSASALHLGVRVNGAEGRIEQLGSGAFGLGDELPRCLALQAPAWRLPALLALTFAEDLAIVDARDATVPWMAVTLPSNWAPEDKVGLPLAQIHAPVPEADLLRQASAGLARLVSGPQRWERFVWNVTDNPRLHCHPRRVPLQRWSHDPLAQGLPRAWFRSERQTFIPVPDQAQGLFTIGVEVKLLAEVVDSRARATRLADAVRSMSPAVLDYRGLGLVREPLLQWLDGR